MPEDVGYNVSSFTEGKSIVIKLEIPWASPRLEDEVKPLGDSEPIIIADTPQVAPVMQALPMLRVTGYALMPGTYVGMNGLVAKYGVDVIRQDSLKLVGRPVGSMHVKHKDNVGYVERVEITSDVKMKVTAVIYDAEEIAMIKSKKHTGFSIDTKVWGYEEDKAFVIMRIGFEKGRVDLVDKPACKECLFIKVEEITQKEKNVTIEVDVKMTNEQEQELAQLREQAKELAKIKQNQAVANEAKIAQLIGEIKVIYPTFDATALLKAASEQEKKVQMLEDLKTQLSGTVNSEAPREILDPKPPADTAAQVAQAEKLEIEMDVDDFKEFIAQQFEQHFDQTVDTMLINDDFRESYDEFVAQEARSMINLI